MASYSLECYAGKAKSKSKVLSCERVSVKIPKEHLIILLDSFYFPLTCFTGVTQLKLMIGLREKNQSGLSNTRKDVIVEPPVEIWLGKSA